MNHFERRMEQQRQLNRKPRPPVALVLFEHVVWIGFLLTLVFSVLALTYALYVQNKLVEYLLILWLFGSPIGYAVLAGRAAENLWCTEHYHKWAFRFFMVSTFGAIVVWLFIKKDMLCG